MSYYISEENDFSGLFWVCLRWCRPSQARSLPLKGTYIDIQLFDSAIFPSGYVVWRVY